METHLAVLRRVGALLLTYAALHVLALAGDLLASQPHAFTVDVVALVLGLLLQRGSLGAARFTAFVHALALACAAGGLVALVVVLALHLVPHLWSRPSSAHEWLMLVWGAGWWLADVSVSLWIVRQLRSPALEAALARARRGSTTSSLRWGAGVGLLLATLIVPAAMFVGRRQLSLEPLAVAAVEQRLGAGWQVELVRMSTTPRGWSAHVIAQRGDEVRELDVGAPPPELE